MAGLIRQSFSMNLKILRIFGMNPPRKHKWLYRLYSYFIFCGMITPVSVLSCLYFLLEDVDLNQISDNAFLAIQMFSKIIKFLPFILNAEEIRRNIEMLENANFILNFNRHEDIFGECIWICRRNCRLFSSFCLFSIIGLSVKPLLRGGKRLPLEIWCPFSIRRNSWLYFLAYIYTLLGVACGGFSNGALDPMLSGMAYHATAQIKALKINLQLLSEDVDDTITKYKLNLELKTTILYQKIQMCVKHHTAILNFMENYEKLFSWVIFSQFAASIFVICICCLFLIMAEPFTPVFFAMIVFLITMLSEVFLYCYYGTTLYEENDSLTNAMYMGKWYEYDIKSRKALILLMERSKRPLVITVGKTLNLSLVTFMKILKSSYSLLAVLKTN